MSTTLEAFLEEHLTDYARDREHYPYSLPDHALRYPGLPALRAALRSSGSHFFDRDTVRFFRSEDHGLIAKRFVVISAQYGDDAPRRYSVRWVYRHMDSTRLQVNRLDTDFDTLQAACAAARTLARLLNAEEA